MRLFNQAGSWFWTPINALLPANVFGTHDVPAQGPQLRALICVRVKNNYTDNAREFWLALAIALCPPVGGNSLTGWLGQARTVTRLETLAVRATPLGGVAP